MATKRVISYENSATEVAFSFDCVKSGHAVCLQQIVHWTIL